MAEVNMPSSYATLAMDGKKIDANNRSIAKSSKALDMLIHTTGVAIIIQSLPHEMGGHLDCSKALKYVQALSAGTSRNRVVQWLHDFSNIRVTFQKPDERGDGGWSAKLIKPGQAGYNSDVDPVKANATPFWEHSREGQAITKAMDDTAIASALQSILNRVEKARKEGNLALSPATLQLVERLKTDQATVSKRAESTASKVGHAVMSQPKVAKVTARSLKAAGVNVDPLALAAAAAG